MGKVAAGDEQRIAVEERKDRCRRLEVFAVGHAPHEQRHQLEVVELGLKTLVQLKKQEKLKCYKGRFKWVGDLEQMRAD